MATSSHRNSSASQYIRLLEALTISPLNTFEIREQLDICAPAAVVQIMREKGLPVMTRYVKHGYHPHVAQYVLLASI
jgi:hypothetical protein